MNLNNPNMEGGGTPEGPHCPQTMVAVDPRRNVAMFSGVKSISADNHLDNMMQISHSVDLILKLVGILWSRTSVDIVDKLSSTSVEFIRSERELENMHIYRV